MFDRERLSSEINKAIAKLREYIAQLTAGAITWFTFRSRVFALLRRLYYEAAGIVTRQRLTTEERRLVEDALADQLYPGGGYSLTELLEEGETDELSMLMLTARLILYLKSAYILAHKVFQFRETAAGNDALYTRRLGATDNHCVECLLYAQLPAQPLSQVVLPGEACRCRGNCLCTLIKSR